MKEGTKLDVDWCWAHIPNITSHVLFETLQLEKEKINQNVKDASFHISSTNGHGKTINISVHNDKTTNDFTFLWIFVNIVGLPPNSRLNVSL